MSIGNPDPTFGPSDNTPITPGSGQIVRTDDVAGVKFQVIKLDVGGPGDSLQVNGSVPVTVLSTPTQGTGGTVPPTNFTVVGGTDGTNAQTISTDTSGQLNVNVVNSPAITGSGTFNVTDLGRVNSSSQIYASAVRTVNPTPLTITNTYARGIMLFLNVTQAPTSFSETLSITILAVDPISGNLFPVTAFTSTPAANSGAFASTPVKYTYELYPGVSAPTGLTSMQAQSGVLPYQFQVTVTHSGSNGWTYSLGAMLLS